MRGALVLAVLAVGIATVLILVTLVAIWQGAAGKGRARE